MVKKKNTIAVDVESSQENKCEEILSEESARVKFPHMEEDFYNQVTGKSIDYAWDLIIEIGNRPPTPENIALGKDMDEIKKKYIRDEKSWKKYYQEMILIYRKHGVENQYPFKNDIEFWEKHLN